MISYQGVSIEREQQILLHDVSFHISEGEFVYLIGKVGSGKSSILKTIYAELPITFGEAKVFDYDLLTLRRRQIPYLRRRLGIVFQDFQLLTDRTVKQNLEFVLRATGWKDRHDIDDRIIEVLRLVGMENKGYRMPNTLSGGEQQRVVIARALLNNPSVILADEPTGNLDPETSRQIVQLLYDICRNQGTAVVMSTHNIQLIDEFPGRVFHVENERVVEEELPKAPETQESLSETQTDSSPDSADSSNVADHCSQSDTSPEEQSYSEQSDRKPSESEPQM